MATSYQEQTSGTLPEWNTQVMDLLNKGKTQAGTAYQPYTGQQVAGLTPQQQQAFQQAGQSIGNWQPGLTQAGNLIGQSASNPLWNQAGQAVQGAAGMDLAGIGSGLYGQAQQGIAGAMGMDLANIGNPMYGQAANMFSGAGQFDPNQLQQYLNPYMSGVVGEIGRIGNEQFQNQVLPGLTGAFSGLGQHGSARQAMMMSDAAARNQREILGQQATALNTGYTNAMGDYLNWAKQGQASAQGLAGLGGQMYNQALGQANLGLQGSQALAGLGAQQYTQGLGQANLGLQAGEQFGSLAGQQSAAQLAAGTGLGNLAQAQQQLSIGDYGQLLNAGTIQQQQQQKELDAAQAQWQQEQQYPWEQLGNYAKLFGTAGAPNQTINWSASFKDGGRVKRMADGGRFPDPMSILDRMRADGITDEEIARDFDTGGEAYRSRLVPAIRLPQDLLREEVSAPVSESSPAIDLMRQIIQRRMESAAELKGHPSLRNQESPSTAMQLGRAMMEASAQGPANWGQLIGRSGSAYFGNQEALDKLNQERAIQQAVLEDKLLPETGRMGVGLRGSTPGSISPYGKIAKDEGFVPGTEEYNNRVNDLAERDYGIRKRTSDTSRGHLGARQTEIGFKYGPDVKVDESGQPITSGASGYNGDTSEQSPVIHPGIAKYESKGLPRKDAQERWDTEQKEYDKLRTERSDVGSTLSSADFGRALSLNDMVEKTSVLPAVAFQMGPDWLPGLTEAVGSDAGKYRSELNAIGARMIPALTKGLTPVSNVDAQSMAKAGIGAGNSYIVNKTNIQRAQSSLRLIKEQDDFYNWAQQNGISPSQAKAEWNKYISKYPLFDVKKAEKDGSLMYNIPPERRSQIMEGYLQKLLKGSSAAAAEEEPRTAETDSNKDPLGLR